MTTPLLLLAGYLGSGKTTLLQHLLATSKQKIAVIMNEFGNIGIDTQTIEKEHVAVKELLEGCVCCSLVGEFEAAVKEIIEEYSPDLIIVETTGIAEADNLVLDIDEELAHLIRLSSVVTVIDSEVMIRFPQLRGNALAQVEAADVLLINKIDLVTKEELEKIKQALHEVNAVAQLLSVTYGKVDLKDLLDKHVVSKKALFTAHDITKMQSVTLTVPHLTKAAFEEFLRKLPKNVERAKGYICLEGKEYLVNYVRGRFSFDQAQKSDNKLVVIGKDLQKGTLQLLLHEKFSERLK